MLLGAVPLPEQRRLVAEALLDVALQAVVADVGCGPLEPLDVDWALGHVKVVPAVHKKGDPCVKILLRSIHHVTSSVQISTVFSSGTNDQTMRVAHPYSHTGSFHVVLK